jgi:hypothetical protein
LSASSTLPRRLVDSDDFSQPLFRRPNLIGQAEHPRPQLSRILNLVPLAIPRYDYPARCPDAGILFDQDEEAKTPQAVHPGQRFPKLPWNIPISESRISGPVRRPRDLALYRLAGEAISNPARREKLSMRPGELPGPGRNRLADRRLKSNASSTG